MKVYESTEVRNVALVGHGNSGKTSLAAGMSFAAGVTNRLTRVDEGNTLTDYDDEEISRKITISTALVAIEWKKMKLNVFDTPGFNLFMYDTKMALAAADAALVVVDGVGGVEVQTEKVWEYSEEFKLPRAFFINRLDRERSDFDRSVANIQEFFGRHAIPVALPIGEEKEFQGVVDLIHMKAYTYTPDGDGKGKEDVYKRQQLLGLDRVVSGRIQGCQPGNRAGRPDQRASVRTGIGSRSVSYTHLQRKTAAVPALAFDTLLTRAVKESPWPYGPLIEMKVAAALVGRVSRPAPDLQVRLPGWVQGRGRRGRRPQTWRSAPRPDPAL